MQRFGKMVVHTRDPEESEEAVSEYEPRKPNSKNKWCENAVSGAGEYDVKGMYKSWE